MTTTTTLKALAHLTAGESMKVIEIEDARRSVSGFRSLDDAEADLKATFPTWIVYRGGNHVALVRASGEPRSLLVVEDEPRERANPASDLYAERLEEALLQLEGIKAALQGHAKRQAADPRNWGLTGDLGRVNEVLDELASFVDFNTVAGR